jgi:predicted Holliday junction resolvase-like endonuclease
MNYLMATMGALAILLILAIYKLYANRSQQNEMLNLQVSNVNLQEYSKDLQSIVIQLQDEVGQEREKNKALLSQKKSSETRLGQISEHLIPFLENCKHDPKTMHFLGNPIDYVVFNFDQGSITFLEVKSGNSKASKRQKTVKNIIKSGRVYYEEIRINEKGIKTKSMGLNGNQLTNTPDEEDEEEDGQN